MFLEVALKKRFLKVVNNHTHQQVFPEHIVNTNHPFHFNITERLMKIG